MQVALTHTKPHLPKLRATESLLVCQPELCVLSMGLGQDSTTILYLLVYNKDFRRLYAPGKLICLFSDTMDEHPQTYLHLEEIKLFCSQHGIEFVHIHPDMGFHGWKGLREFYGRTNTVGSVAFVKSCTDNLKIKPIYSYLEKYVGDEYNLPVGAKQGLRHFATKYGKIRVLIGIAKGEEKRMADPSKEKQRWKRESISTVYPLVDLGMDRGDCQRYITAVGHKVPLPSNCRLCPYMSEKELLWMHRFYPEDLEAWKEFENNKFEKFKDKGEKNFGVFGKKSLSEALAQAIEKHGHMTDEELWENKMTHGHCVKSVY